MGRCYHCIKPIGKGKEVTPSPNEFNIDSIFIMTDDESSGIICMKNNGACGIIEIDYCPFCGRKLSW